MKLQKSETVTTIKAEFSRGGFIEGALGKNFVTLSIPAMKEFMEDYSNKGYAYSNWTLYDLQDLEDAIHAFLNEMKVNNPNRPSAKLGPGMV